MLSCDSSFWESKNSMERQVWEKLSSGLMEVVLHFAKAEKAFLKGQGEFGLEMCFLSVTFSIEKGVDGANPWGIQLEQTGIIWSQFLKASFLSEKLLLGLNVNILFH